MRVLYADPRTALADAIPDTMEPLRPAQPGTVITPRIIRENHIEMARRRYTLEMGRQ
jgi:hypothetical protein